MAPPNTKKSTSFKASLTQEERFRLADLKERMRNIQAEKKAGKRPTETEREEQRYKRADAKEEKRKMEAEKKRARKEVTKASKLAKLEAKNEALKQFAASGSKQAAGIPDELKTESDSEPEVQEIPPREQAPVNPDDIETESEPEPDA